MRGTQGVCAEVREQPHRGASWDPLQQGRKPYLRQNREAWKGRNTSLLARKWNGERREDVTVATKTYTHTHTSQQFFSSFFPGSCVRQLQRRLPESPIMKWEVKTKAKTKKNKKGNSSLQCFGMTVLGHLNVFSASSSKNPVLASLLANPNHPDLPLLLYISRWQKYCSWAHRRAPSFDFWSNGGPEKLSDIPRSWTN